MIKLLNAKVLSLLFGAIFVTSLAIAQEDDTKQHASAPIPVEVFFGNNRFVSQFSFMRKFTENGRLGFLATSYIAAGYGNDKEKNESMNVALFNYEILKGFGVVGGAALNSHWGFRPYSGVQYVYANKQLMAMLMPGFYLTESHNLESVGFIEYRPHLKNKWSLFTRLEGMYNLDMDTKKHDRSHIYCRLGLNYKTLGFGFAEDYDWYGPFKIYKNNMGIFIRKVFI